MIIKIQKYNLSHIFDRLKSSHKLIGPKIENNAIILSEIEFHDIPAGYRDQQSPGCYKLKQGENAEVFSFSPGPDSFKRFLHPPFAEIFRFEKSKKGITISPSNSDEKPFAFIGIRACDISAMKLYDRVFSGEHIRDKTYESLRKNCFIMAVNCIYPGDNCFCQSIGTGPEVKDYFDIVITEIRDSFILETGTVAGERLLTGLQQDRVNDNDMKERNESIQRCGKAMKKAIKFDELPWLIYRNLEHPRWAEIEKRDLECGNCTQVCPTCFCNSSYDLVSLSGVLKKSEGLSGVRIRAWDSCFSKNFARVHGGNFRPSRKARYRQWMSHKLAYTFEQFGLPGCVGCGRCITWCPVGIDITHELEALRNAR
ncbi:MAG: 4Fe-4S dicluster domain-containing protein [Thermodesulfovibrionales bacterium]|nr:4Fe-4S dicluster domain-containing protein [Thermodesulfovibrionales bacterium]